MQTADNDETLKLDLNSFMKEDSFHGTVITAAYIDDEQTYQRASPRVLNAWNVERVTDDVRETTTTTVSNDIDFSRPTRLRGAASEKNMSNENVYINPRKRTLFDIAEAEQQLQNTIPATKRKSRPIQKASRRAREQELILQREPFILYIDDQQVELCGHREGIFAHKLEHRICGFSEAVRDRIKPGASYLQGPCELYKTYYQKYRLGLSPLGDNPDDFICFFSYDHDICFSLDCTYTNSFGPRGPPHKYVYVMRKSATNIFNYLLIRRDIEPCLKFVTPPRKEYIQVTRGISKNNTVKICHFIAMK